MKFFAALALILPAVSALVPTATTKREFLSLNPDPATLAKVAGKREFLSLNPDPVILAPLKLTEPRSIRETNGDRLRRGLNPLAPRNLRRRGATGVQPARPRRSSTPPTQHAGVIEARQADGSLLGYLSATSNDFGEYVITTDGSNASPVSFSASSDGGHFSITAAAGSSNYPFLGAITGYLNVPVDEDLTPGSYNYAYLGGVLEDATSGPATAQGNTYTEATGLSEATQSAIWTIDATTNAVTPAWTNTDGSEHALQVVVVEGFFAITADAEALRANFGRGTDVKLVLVQSVVL